MFVAHLAIAVPGGTSRRCVVSYSTLPVREFGGGIVIQRGGGGWSCNPVNEWCAAGTPACGATVTSSEPSSAVDTADT